MTIADRGMQIELQVASAEQWSVFTARGAFATYFRAPYLRRVGMCTGKLTGELSATLVNWIARNRVSYAFVPGRDDARLYPANGPHWSPDVAPLRTRRNVYIQHIHYHLVPHQGKYRATVAGQPPPAVHQAGLLVHVQTIETSTRRQIQLLFNHRPQLDQKGTISTSKSRGLFCLLLSRHRYLGPGAVSCYFPLKRMDERTKDAR